MTECQLLLGFLTRRGDVQGVFTWLCSLTGYIDFEAQAWNPSSHSESFKITFLSFIDDLFIYVTRAQIIALMSFDYKDLAVSYYIL